MNTVPKFQPGLALQDGSKLNQLVALIQGGNWNVQYTTPSKTLQAVINQAVNQTMIIMAAGEYDEEVVIPASLNNLLIYCPWGRGAAFIATSTTNGVALTNNADDVTLINVGCDGDGAGAGLINTGSRFRAYGCKFEGDDIAWQFRPGTVATEAAGTEGRCGDCLLSDCETAWAATGGLLTGTDFGGVTQLFLDSCRFHNNATKCLTESVGSGGSAAVTFFNLELRDCIFDDLEDGTAPTNYIDLNADNANSGIVSGCRFPTAINSGLNLVSTALHWVSNYHTGGVSTAQPS